MMFLFLQMCLCLFQAVAVDHGRVQRAPQSGNEEDEGREADDEHLADAAQRGKRFGE